MGARKALMARSGMTEERLAAIEAASGAKEADEQYEQIIGLAAALEQSGFTGEEIRRYFRCPMKAESVELLQRHRWEIVESMHELQQKLGRIDYLLFMERSGR